LRTILNRIYKINTPPPYWFRRITSIVQFFIITLVISFAMFLLVIIPIGLSKIPTISNAMIAHSSVVEYWRYTLIFISLFGTVAALYYVIPNAKLTFVEILPGAFLTVVLWIISGQLLSKYIIYYNQLNVVYGSLGSIIITLLFFYVINVLFIYGAVFNYLYSRKKW
ncbi:MAG: hypothetical protein RLZZ59_676, partial [Pseudomonadota bacterium]